MTSRAVGSYGLAVETSGHTSQKQACYKAHKNAEKREGKNQPETKAAPPP